MSRKIIASPAFWRMAALFFLVVLTGAWCGLPPARAATNQNVITFTDLQGHWARSQVTQLAALELVKGYPDRTFKPDQLVNRLEAVTLVIRSGGFAADAEKLAAASKASSKLRSSKAKNNAGGEAPISTPRVPWGQAYLDLAVGKEFLQLKEPDDFNFDGPASRLEVAGLLARALYLVPSSSLSTADKDGGGAPSATLPGNEKVFADEALVPQKDLAIVRAVSVAGVMTGYPDGTFRPQEPITRAEMSAILSRLADRGWVKTAGDRRLAGWISSVKKTKGGRLDMEMTSLSGVQKLQVDNGSSCYRDGNEWPLEKAVNFRCELILNGRRQVGWVKLLETKDGEESFTEVRGSVKSVALGEDNLIVFNDLNCEDRIMPLAWDAVVTGKNARQGFKTLKAGDFVDVGLAQGQVRQVKMLEVKTVSGTVDRFDNRRFYFKEDSTIGRPGWFNHWDRARVVDKDGARIGDILIGDSVQVTYLDTIPNEIDEEIPLEIKVTGNAR